MAQRNFNVLIASPDLSLLSDYETNDYRVAFGRLECAHMLRGLSDIDLIYVDWLLSDMSGMEMCRKLRAIPSCNDTFITMMLHRDTAEDRRRALDAGADSYIVGTVKRDDVDNTIATIAGSKIEFASSSLVQAGDLAIDPDTRVARWKGELIELRRSQFEIMLFFATHPNELITRQQLIEGISKLAEVSDERTVDVWIKRLRRKLNEQNVSMPIKTVHGCGYILDLT